jgi:ribosomal protein S27AE
MSHFTDTLREKLHCPLCGPDAPPLQAPHHMRDTVRMECSRCGLWFIVNHRVAVRALAS